MALTPRLEVRQTQTLVMTPQLQQAIKLLQMSNLELAEYVAAEVEKNPLLELAPPPAAPIAGPRAGSGDDFDPLSGLAAEVTLWDHLREQIRAMRLRPDDAEAALAVADELEEDGYLRAPLAEVAARHRKSLAEAARALAVVQTCEPAGVGARSLAECLALQLRDRDRLDPAMQALLENLRLVAIAVPDVYVTRAAAGGLTVELNTDTLPRVLANNAYARDLAAGDAATRAFVSECRARAGWLVRSLEQRARTILKVASEIASHQERFFSHGVGHLRPLTQRAVADRVGMHESTVSRVTTGKYLACDQGNFELHFFFSPAIQALSGGEAFSSAAVQERMRVLIQAEKGAQPLSDDKIVAVLNKAGIDIARRTVAKYRDAMGIPSSVERRRLKSPMPRI